MFVSTCVLTVLCIKTIKFIRVSKRRSQGVLDNFFFSCVQKIERLVLVTLINAFQVLHANIRVTVTHMSTILHLHLLSHYSTLNLKVKFTHNAIALFE